jgi:hypothetical protein
MENPANASLRAFLPAQTMVCGCTISQHLRLLRRFQPRGGGRFERRSVPGQSLHFDRGAGPFRSTPINGHRQTARHVGVGANRAGSTFCQLLPVYPEQQTS